MSPRGDENRYFAAALKAAGHRQSEIREMAGYNHDASAAWAIPRRGAQGAGLLHPPDGAEALAAAVFFRPPASRWRSAHALQMRREALDR
jgi:hypothetical protein